MKKIFTIAIALFLISQTQAQFFALEKEPENTFGEIQSGQRTSVALADIDEDGDLDVYLTNNNNIRIYINDGSANFTYSGYLFADGEKIDILWPEPTFADVDGDNDLDLYVGTYQGRVEIFINDGLGNFSSVGLLQADNTTIDIGAYAVPVFADFDEDNDLDLYIGSSDELTHIFINDGSGNFTANGVLTSNGYNISAQDPAAPEFADLDGDGDLDFFLGSVAGEIRYYQNDGSGNLTFSSFLTVAGAGSISYYHPNQVFGDIDNDGSLDFLLTGSNGKVLIYHTSGTAALDFVGNMEAVNAPICNLINLKPTFADLDKDGDLDLYVNGEGRFVTEYLNDGNNNYTYTTNLQADSADISVNQGCIKFADLDNDNDDDIYISDYYGKVFVYENDGTNTFSYTGYLQADSNDLTGGIRANICFGDIDNDNDLDIITGNQDGNLKLFINDGSGNFSVSGFLEIDGVIIDAGNKISPALWDLDNDGDLDLFVAATSKVRTYLNDGLGNFSNPDLVNFGGELVGSPYNISIELADIDNDNQVELLSGNYEGLLTQYKLLETAITNQPQNQPDLCVNTQVDMFVDADFADIYQWQISTDLGITFTNITDTVFFTGTQTNTLQIVPDTSTINMLYRCIVSNINYYDTSNVANFSIETVAPMLSTQNITAYLDTNGEITVNLAQLIVSASDNCFIADTTIDQNSFECNSIGDNNVVVTLTDSASNFTIENAIVTVEDTIAPEIICIIDTIISLQAGETVYTIQGSLFDPISFDNCNITNTVNDFNNSNSLDGAQLSVGENNINWTVTDESGNQTYCTFNISVETYVGVKTLNNSTISIYPNPTQNIVNINLGGLQNVDISISDIAGKVLYKKENINKDVYTVDFTESEGVYFVEIKSDEKIQILKLIKK